MLAIDTNVLLRYLSNDDAAQVSRARTLIDSEASEASPLLVCNEVFVEVYWFLAKRLKLGRMDISFVLRGLLNHRHLCFSDRDALDAAVTAYSNGPCGLPDYLIAFAAARQGAVFTYTFDRDAAKHQGFRLLY